MNSKKAITLLVLITMLMSLVPILPVQAITGTTVDDLDVYVGDKVLVHGTGVTAGATVEVYWDSVQPWDGEAGKLNSTKAKASGYWECYIKIPEAVGSDDHYVWARDLSTGSTDHEINPVVVRPSLKLDPTSGLVGDTVTMTGHGYDGEVDIDSIQYLNVANITLTTTPTVPVTSTLGKWTATFKIPSLSYGAYSVYATDESNYDAVATLTVGESITLDKKEGPEGSKVKITGRGFAVVGDIVTGDVRIDGTLCEVVTEDEIGGSPTYSFVVEVIIPSIGEGEYEITVIKGAYTASADFEITGEASITVTPTFGVQGSTIAISGGNFSQWNEGEVSIELWSTAPLHLVDITTLETTANGVFNGVFTVPARSNGKYMIYAMQSDYGVNATDDFKIGSVIVILSKTSGPSGRNVILTGTGFEWNVEWNATIGDILVVEGMTDGSGNLEEGVGNVPTFWVPTLAPGVYSVTVMDETGTTVEVDFTVTQTTKLETDPLSAPAGYNISLEGTYFSQDEGADLDIIVSNSTDEWDISNDVKYGGLPVAVLNEDDMGEWVGYWMIPDDWDLGAYTLNVTDENDLTAEYVLQIVPKTVAIQPRKASFRIGETVAFVIEHSFRSDDSYVKIWDPTGNLYWQTDLFTMDSWVKVGTIYRLPFFEQVAGGNLLTLLEDAPLGTWTWKWYDNDDELLDDGSFTVTESAENVLGQQVADLNNQLTDLADQIDDVSGEFDTVKSDIASVRAVAQQAVTAAQQAAQAVQTVAQTANQANTAAQNAADAANAAKDAANGLTTLVYGAIGAALVAALAAIVSLMQISRRIAG